MNDNNHELNMAELEIIQEYPNREMLMNICRSFEEQELSLTVRVMGIMSH